MILTGTEIMRQVELGAITISPFDRKKINPNSYDFCLGGDLLVYRRKILDAKKANATRQIHIDTAGVELSPERIYLGHTVEHFATDQFVPIFFAKSSIARLGLFIHVTANLIDIGHRGQWTLHLHAVQPLRIYPGMLIGQATFWRTEGDVRLYSGKYQDSEGPIASRLSSEL